MDKTGKILIVDDNKQILDSLEILLKSDYKIIHSIKNPNLIPEKIRTESYDIILLDMNFKAGVNSGNEGLYWLKEILKNDLHAVVILITAFADVNLAVTAMKEGATDFITKPWDTEKLLATLSAGYKLRQSKLEVNNLKVKQQQLKDDIDRHYNMYTGTSRAMNEVFKTIEKVAVTDANVLILGENGTGKELIAREIHRKSKRSGEIFVGVDMGSLSESLFESEMFGHTKGSFTDAKSDRTGRFESATGGTLFLDEIGNLSAGPQAKLLSAIQNKQITRLGSNAQKKINIRLICATNRDLDQMVRQGVFREDLLYRINTVQITLPALRERKEDITGLADCFLQQYKHKYGKPDLFFNQETINKLTGYVWPGNIRELKHAVERAVILSDQDEIVPEDFSLSNKSEVSDILQSYNLEDVEQQTISKVLEKCRGNMSKAAKMLNISRTTLYSKIEKYNLNY